MTHYTMCPDDPAINWRVVPGYAGRYEASDSGLVRRATSTRTYPRHSLLVQGRSKDGYCTITLYKDGKYCPSYVHRVVMFAFKGECDKGIEVNHKNGIRDDNRLSNLEYVTHQQNQHHALYTTGNLFVGYRDQRGAANHNAKLNDDKVREMRKLYRAGSKPLQLSERYGISTEMVRAILKYRYWRHVE